MNRLHPQIIGRPNRLRTLQAFMRTPDDAWFSNCMGVANVRRAPTGKNA